MRISAVTLSIVLGALLVTAAARADEPLIPPEVRKNDDHDRQQDRQEPGASSPARPETDAATEPPKKEDESDPPDKRFTVAGYVEAFYGWNFGRPGNGITAYRGYDNRHNSFTLQNAVIDVGFRAWNVLARVALQVGNAPAAIYRDEPSLPGAEGASESDAQLWRYLQRASLGWQASKAVLLEAGVFPSVSGVESLAVKENWNWSRSTASVRLPNYHAGIRGTFNLSERVDVFTAVINGWNDIGDQNDEKSFIAGMHYKRKDKLTISGTYFGGVEREAGAKEGRAWRHGFEAWAQLDATDRLSFAADGSTGFERTRFGTHFWASAAGYARVKMLEWLYGAARVDALWETPAENALGESESFLIDAKRIASVTATLDFRPVKGISARLEYRHDGATQPLFFRGDTIEGDGSDEKPFVPNARVQDTALLGLTAWF